MMRLLFLARALQNREVGRRPKESETHIEIEEGDGNDKWYWNVLLCSNHNHIFWSFTNCLEFLESPQENTEQESWTGWAWNLVPSLPAWTEDWTEDDNENRGFTFQSGIYIDDLAFNLRVILHFHFPVQCHWSLQCVPSSLYFQVLFVSFSSFFLSKFVNKLICYVKVGEAGSNEKNSWKNKVEPFLTLSLRGCLLDYICHDNVWVNSQLGICSIQLEPIGACSCGVTESAADKVTHYLPVQRFYFPLAIQ